MAIQPPDYGRNYSREGIGFSRRTAACLSYMVSVASLDFVRNEEIGRELIRLTGCASVYGV